ncbi:MAG: Histidyl-tRNA synthetase [Candidatus Fermentimicrarchaeum limneticum]|uniref:Histidine--tRNA ligase n=1 Tax=Fermentimicrarchaeum limneticum TaxID=2795018 RepID=A0A7D5XHA2_FERL1|nr:MAG: Histidyl-tRNA synthetase [Candidatus Fermentimicrarchaeum limneticum]
MTSPESVSNPKGMRDLKSDEMKVRERMMERMKGVFRLYGFVPLETPALENWEVLSAKGAGGEEILNETYNFEDKGGRRIGLRYDLTVPLARFVAMSPSMPLPFKRYQIGSVWRYGDVARGRLREFWQADVDIVGSESMLADAEVIACTIDVFRALGFKNFTVRLNNRKILSAMMAFAGVEGGRVDDAFRAIDKLEKVGREKVLEELSQRGVGEGASGKLMELLSLEGSPKELLGKAEKLIGKAEDGKQGIGELKELLSYLEKMGVEKNVKVDFSLARGMEYYTGPIFEVFFSKEVGSLAGGGRYDRMIGLFLGKEIAATGISFGIERIAEVLEGGEKKADKSVFIACVDESLIGEAVGMARKFRENGIPAMVDLRKRSLAKQLGYADSLNVSYVVIIGKNELKEGKVKLRDFGSGEEKLLTADECIKLIKNR